MRYVTTSRPTVKFVHGPHYVHFHVSSSFTNPRIAQTRRRSTATDCPSTQLPRRTYATVKKKPTDLIDGGQRRPAFVLRVFRGDPTPATPPDGRAYLRPPAIEKNFLISPPGSPPVGWEQVVEEPPNATPLADDLIAALRNLQLAAGTAAQGGGREMLLDPEDGAGIGVYVEDCDLLERAGDDDELRDWAYGEDNPSRLVYKPVPTALPPM